MDDSSCAALDKQEHIWMGDSLPCGVCRVQLDKQFTICQANDFYYSMYGYTREQAEKEGFVCASFAVHPSDLEKVSRHIWDCLSAGEKIFELEHRCVSRIGKILWMLIRCQADDSKDPSFLNCVFFDITDRKVIEENLRISEEESRIMFQHSNMVLSTYDIPSRTLYQTQASAEILRLPQVVKNAPYSIVERGTICTESIPAYVNFYESMIHGIPSGEAVVRVHEILGPRWYSAKYTLVLDSDGLPKRAVLAHQDITGQREKELAYEKWNQYFEQQRLNSMGYLEYNLTRNLYNGNSPNDSLNLPPYIHTFTDAVRYFADNFVYEDDLEKYFAFYNRERLIAQYYSGEREDRFEYRRKKGSDGFFWASGYVQMVLDPYEEDVKAFILVQDIDEEKQAQMRIQARIERDELTGIYNRAAIMEKVSDCLNAHWKHYRHMFIMLDVDCFKNLNDSYGHQFGDMVLKDMASLMSETIREGDICGRLGGDEFILLLRDIPSLSVAEKRLKQLCKRLEKTYDTGAHISISIGAVYPCTIQDFDVLYKKADIALYEAKGLGRNQYVIYHPKGSDAEEIN